MTSSIERSIELQAPARTAYDQCTQFERFPDFLEHVQEVEQLDDRNLRCRVKMAGQAGEGTVEITEQIPDKRIAWRSTSGPTHAGCVTFHRLSDGTSKVMFQADFEAEGVPEDLAADMAAQVVQRGLDAFKEFIEARGEETGAWRGSIPSKDDVET